MNHKKLNEQELAGVSGGTAAVRLKNYCIVDSNGKVVASFTSLEEAKEDFENYGPGYSIIEKP